MTVGNFFKNWIVRNLLAAFAFFVVFLVVVIFSLKVITRHDKEIAVPDFTNMTVEEAQVVAAQYEVKLDVTDSVYVKRMRRGAIYRQNPKPGSFVKSGRRVILTINAVNAKQVAMPELVGYSTRQARSELLSKGLRLEKLVYVEDIATNNVLKQLYGNREVKPGTMLESDAAITLVVGLSELDKDTHMPYIMGLKNLTAVDALHSSSLNVGRMYFDETVKDYSDSLSAVVYRQVPEYTPIAVQMGEEITVYLTMDAAKVPEKPVFDEEGNIVTEEVE